MVAAWTGGLSLAARKRPASSAAIRLAPPPRQAILALQQGPVCPAAVPCVQPGQPVRRGERVARAPQPDGADLHSPISGTVLALETRATATHAAHGPCLIIDGRGTGVTDSATDWREAPAPGSAPLPDYTQLAPMALLEWLRGAGLAGLGGAAFPGSAKLETARQRGVTHLVLNGAECEPWICCDDRLMRERAPDVLRGAQIMLHALGATRCTLGIEDDKPEAIAAIQAALSTAGDARLALRVVPSVYPAGSECQLLEALCGCEVPRHGLPADVGVLCHNVGTAAAVARFIAHGEPLLRRIVTITGSGVASPCNVEAWIGTPLAQLIELAGGYTADVQRLIVGGGMTGLAVASDEVPLTKASNCIIAATGADLASVQSQAMRACIRCGRCAEVCPADLLPQQLHWAARAGDLASLDRHGLDACIECGCCDYVCPSQIPLTPQFRAAKASMLAAGDEALRASDWRERHRQRLARDVLRAQSDRDDFLRARQDGAGDD